MPLATLPLNSSNTKSPNYPPLADYRNEFLFQIQLATRIFSAIAAVYFLYLSVRNGSWQPIVISGTFIIAWLFSAFASSGSIFKGQAVRLAAMYCLFLLALCTFSILISGMAIAGAVIILLYSLIFSNAILGGEDKGYGLNLGLLFSSLAAVVGTIAPFEQVSAQELFAFIPAVLGILVMVYLVMVMMQISVGTLRVKLISSTLAIVLIPLILLSFINVQYTQGALQTQINQSLALAADQTADKIDEFLERTENTVIQQAAVPVFTNFLSLDAQERKQFENKKQIQYTVESLQFEHNEYLSSIAILSLSGENIFDTSQRAIGMNEREAEYFTIPYSTRKSYVSPVLFSQETSASYIYFSAPIRDDHQELIGILRVRFDALVFQNIIEENSNSLGPRTFPILFDDNLVRLADSSTPNALYKTLGDLLPVEYAALRKENRLPNRPNYLLSSNLDDFAVTFKAFPDKSFFTQELHSKSAESHVEIGAVRMLTQQPWVLVYTQQRADLLKILKEQNRVSTLVAALIASMVSIVATFLARMFSNPIQSLTETASKIAAGDLTARTVVKTNDEIGTLANAFNLMTSQLSTLVNELEDRVKERTQELANQNEELVYRSQQLQTVADVARGITAAQDLESLLTQIAALISQRFHFYHVGVFLIDESGEYAYLRAANSEGGKNMLARHHKLQIGKVGIVGYVTSTGEPRIATDVGEDAVYFNNPDLPMTRSEMALPLKVSDQIIGALDVQSIESNAFSKEDIDLFSTLADQVAIAIENNRLFTETANALEEAQNTTRQYLYQEWNRELSERKHLGYVFTPQGVTEQDVVVEVMDAIRGKDLPVAIKNEEDNQAAVAVPIQIRGETVGVIRAQDNSAGREWTDDELNMMKSVADQVAVALENARLFEQTVRRADREKRTMEITNKIRSTNDPQEMLQIAVEELQKALKASSAHIIFKPANEAEPSNGNGSGNHKDQGNAG